MTKQFTTLKTNDQLETPKTVKPTELNTTQLAKPRGHYESSWLDSDMDSVSSAIGVVELETTTNVTASAFRKPDVTDSRKEHLFRPKRWFDPEVNPPRFGRKFTYKPHGQAKPTDKPDVPVQTIRSTVLERLVANKAALNEHRDTYGVSKYPHDVLIQMADAQIEMYEEIAKLREGLGK